MSVADVMNLVQQAQSIGDNDKLNAAIDSAQQIQQKVQQSPITQWVRNIPRNVTVGLMDAAVNTVDAADEFGNAAAKNFTRPSPADEVANEQQGLSPEGKTPEQLRMDYLNAGGDQPSLYSRARGAFLGLRDEMAAGSNTADTITQGAAQFMIPFLGWSKLFGATKVLSAARLAAESATAGTAFSPHSGRAADLLSLAQHSEGKLADVMNTIAPDGSLLNKYIDYMTNRDGETDAEGRFKNVVDNLGLTAAVAGVLKTGATTLKVGFGLPGYIAENAGAGPVGPAAQEGKIVFHGTPHDFEQFDTSKIGTGEGHQVFGHGLYFAEDPKVANHYVRVLSSRGSNTGDAAQDYANNALSLAGGDKDRAVGTLNTLLRNADSSGRDSSVLKQAIGHVQAGRAKVGGTLMHVDIPDEKIAQMLDHDKLMRDQPEILNKIPSQDRDKLAETLDENGLSPDLEEYTGGEFRQILGRAIRDDRIDFMPRSGNFDNQKALESEYLSDHGIPGIKYLDQGSRGGNGPSGSRNIVLFNARDAKIVKKEKAGA